MWSWVGHEPHHLAYLVVSDLVITEQSVVYEKSAAHLVADNSRQNTPPGDSENHIERKSASPDSAELVVSAKVVERSSTKSCGVGKEAHWEVLCVLQLGLSEEMCVGIAADLLGESHHVRHSFQFIII